MRLMLIFVQINLTGGYLVRNRTHVYTSYIVGRIFMGGRNDQDKGSRTEE